MAESGDKKEEDESNASDWRFVALVLKVRVERELGMLDLEEPPTARLREQSWGRPSHLLQDGDEEVELNLSRTL